MTTKKKAKANPEMVEIMRSILDQLDSVGLGEKYGYDYCGYTMICLGSAIVSDHCGPYRVQEIFETEIMPNLLKGAKPMILKSTKKRSKK